MADMRAVETGITEDIFSVLSVESALQGRTSFGGAAPENVKRAAGEARKRFFD
jgi:argininosuccinate lyase